MIRLCRAYDDTKKGHGLPNLLREIESNFTYFETEQFQWRLMGREYVGEVAKVDRIPDRDLLFEHQRFCSKDHEPVRKLIAWRSNIFVHTSQKLTIRNSPLGPNHAPTYEEIELLLEEGLGIVNYYSGLYTACSHSTSFVGADDYMNVFKALSRARKAWDDELRAEAERWGLEWPLG